MSTLSASLFSCLCTQYLRSLELQSPTVTYSTAERESENQYSFTMERPKVQAIGSESRQRTRLELCSNNMQLRRDINHDTVINVFNMPAMLANLLAPHGPRFLTHAATTKDKNKDMKLQIISPCHYPSTSANAKYENAASALLSNTLRLWRAK